VVRMDVLKKHPELEAVLLKLTHTITDQDMSYMNYEVESEGQKPHDVAERYLRTKGLLY
ncbi:MAG: glycine/betaine ABC transporter substrate-binding protein, partial [Veillonella sp.]|nr:glycine/betaine ABC transporter substrate-binding protein [Veillonella sp.]